MERRAVIQIQDNYVAFNGSEWSAIRGPIADGLARVLQVMLPEFGVKQYYPDMLYGVAFEAAEYFEGGLVSCDPMPYDPLTHTGRIY